MLTSEKLMTKIALFLFLVLWIGFIIWVFSNTNNKPNEDAIVKAKLEQMCKDIKNELNESHAKWYEEKLRMEVEKNKPDKSFISIMERTKSGPIVFE